MGKVHYSSLKEYLGYIVEDNIVYYRVRQLSLMKRAELVLMKGEDFTDERYANLICREIQKAPFPECYASLRLALNDYVTKESRFVLNPFLIQSTE